MQITLFLHAIILTHIIPFIVICELTFSQQQIPEKKSRIEHRAMIGSGMSALPGMKRSNPPINLKSRAMLGYGMSSLPGMKRSAPPLPPAGQQKSQKSSNNYDKVNPLK